MATSKSIRIVEVGPRDGLQNEKKILDVNIKVTYIKKLVDAGLKTIEATSFVREDKIPQMGDSQQLFKSLIKEVDLEEIALPCLVPNERGLENALSVGVREIAVFSSTSDSFNKKNVNATVDESLARIEKVNQSANQKGLKIRGYISTVFGCPYEGETSVDKLVEVSKKLQDQGVYEISLGDTIGVGNPRQVEKILNHLVKKGFNQDFFAMHFHDTWGMALANVSQSLNCGITNFDSSSGGLGGCPYAKGASGNLATEELVYLCDGLGYKTGVNLERLCQASLYILDQLEKEPTSKYLQAYKGSDRGK